MSCPLGITEAELEELLGPALPRFHGWMYGQTMALCEGRSYNHATKEYEPSACAGNPHGVVVYRSDVDRFLRGLPILD